DIGEQRKPAGHLWRRIATALRLQTILALAICYCSRTTKSRRLGHPPPLHLAGNPAHHGAPFFGQPAPSESSVSQFDPLLNQPEPGAAVSIDIRQISKLSADRALSHV